MDCRYLYLAFALLQASLSYGFEYQGRVVKVSDGDTVTVLDSDFVEHKVRLLGIDAPEKGQPWGRLSKDNLGRMAFQKLVTVQTSKRDRYGREIGKVLVDGSDINLRQIQDGYAWHYKQYQSEQSWGDRWKYSNAEAEARQSRLGLWQDVTPTPPWDFRRARRH